MSHATTGEGNPLALITGASGFAGIHLVRQLEAQSNWTIVGLARRSSSAGSHSKVLACDLQDSDLVERVIKRYRPDVIFHLAAQSYVPKSFAAPTSTITNNIVGQINVLEACRAARIDPVILVVGSSEEYGVASADEMPLTENQPLRPGNPYAVSKVTQDMLGFQYHYAHGMRIVRVRPFNHLGPGQTDRFALSSFARQIAEAEQQAIEPQVLTGDLNAERDFLDVRDVVRAYRIAVEHGEPGEVYNLASGVSRRIGDLLDYLLSLATVSIKVVQDPARLRPSDIPRLVGDPTKFQAATGWTPEIPIEQSLQDTLDYWRRRIRSSGDRA